MKAKTIKQWLETLPPALKKSALKQIKPHEKSNGFQLRTHNLSMAIYCFSRCLNPVEGYDFWEALFQALVWAEVEDLKE